MVSSKYSIKITLFNSYFDCNDKIKPTAIFNIFQDVACIHGEQIGVGFNEMLSKQLYWVLSRVKYDIICDPTVMQEVLVETWPCEKGKVDFDRDFLIKDLNGNVLIKGTSKWCVISTVTRALEKTTNVTYLCECISEKNYEERFVKTPHISQSEFPAYTHKVAFNEIDHNQHLNNINYATYVTNTLKNIHFSHLQINFISECKLDETIKVYYEKVKDEYLISGYVNDVLKFSALAK